MGRDWWEAWDYPSRIMDQCFGTHLCDRDLLSPTLVRGYYFRPRSQASLAASGQSEVSNDEQQFQVSLNVSQFKPEELQVKVVDRYVVVHGKHEERNDEHGFVSREFTRRYMLPKACEPDTVASSLSPEGMLTIIAPKKALEEPPKQERNVPIASEAKIDESATVQQR